MNDHELDEMLNQWGVPPVRAELRERVRTGFVAAPKRRYFPSIGWKGLFAGFATAAIVFLVVAAEAFPSVLGTASPVLRPPYLAMSNVTVYAKDGSSRLQSTVYSYGYKGSEIVRMEEDPDDRLHQAIINIHASMHLLFLRFAPDVVMPESSSKDAWFSGLVKSGCVDKGDVVIGHEKVLGYETTVVQNTGLPRARVGDGYDGWRWTGWLSPDLGCFPLRTRNEELVAGVYRLTKKRDTVQVIPRGRDTSIYP